MRLAAGTLQDREPRYLSMTLKIRRTKLLSSSVAWLMKGRYLSSFLAKVENQRTPLSLQYTHSLVFCYHI